MAPLQGKDPLYEVCAGGGRVPVLVGFPVHYDEGLGHCLHPSACGGS